MSSQTAILPTKFSDQISQVFGVVRTCSHQPDIILHCKDTLPQFDMDPQNGTKRNRRLLFGNHHFLVPCWTWGMYDACFFFIPLYTRTVSCFSVINWKTWKIKTRHIFAYWWFRNPAVTRWGKGSLSLYLQLFIHSRWLFGISSIKRMSSIFVFVWYVIWSKSYSEPCFWCFIYIHHILFSCIITFIFSGFSQHNLFTSLLLDDTGVDFFIRIISYCLFIGFSIYYYMSMCVFFFWAFLCCFIILNS